MLVKGEFYAPWVMKVLYSSPTYKAHNNSNFVGKKYFRLITIIVNNKLIRNKVPRD